MKFHFSVSQLLFLLFLSLSLAGCNDENREKLHCVDNIHNLQVEFKNLQTTLESLNQEVKNLELNMEVSKSIAESDFENLNEKYRTLQNDYWNLNDKIIEIEVKESVKNEAFFNLSEGIEGFQTINSSSGAFIITLESVIPHLAGYKLIFSIGNPSAATYEHAILHLKWNRSYQNYKNDKEFLKKLENYEIEYSLYLQKIKQDSDFRKNLKRSEKPSRPNWCDEFKEKEFSILKPLASGRWSKVEVHLTPAVLGDLDWIQVSLRNAHYKPIKR